MYKRLAKHLVNTRKPLFQVCKEQGIDIEEVDDYLLQQTIDQCSNCNIWSQKLIEDLDGNPICPLCVRVAGL